MKKRSVVFVLFVLFALGTIFAQTFTEPSFSGRDTDTLWAINPNTPNRNNRNAGRLSGIVCVYYTDAQGKLTSSNVPFNVAAGQREEVFRIRGGKIDGWSTISCNVVSDYD